MHNKSSFSATICSTLLLTVAACTFSNIAQAQINENRAYMERLERLEHDLNNVQRQLGNRSGDADADPAIMS